MAGEEIRFNLMNNTTLRSDGVMPQSLQQQANPTEIGDLLRRPKINITSLLGKKEPTEQQIAAREQLDTKVSSTGVSYKDAKAVLKEIEEKYGNDPKYQSEFESEQPKDKLIYIPPSMGFDPYKLPEEVREKYFEALNSAQEIEQNNAALMKKTGLNNTKSPEPTGLIGLAKSSGIDGKGLILWPSAEPTPKEIAAREKLDDKESSTGVKYKDAKATLKEIQEKYGNNPEYQSEFASEQPKDKQKYIPPYMGFDPYKLPADVREKYFEALENIMEIEQKNSALFAQTGLSETKKPSMPGLISVNYRNFDLEIDQ